MPSQAFAKSVAKEFGAELRRVRMRADMTQQALAERAEIDPVFVSFLENGHRQPSLAVVVTIERALGLASGALVRRVTLRLTSSPKDKRPKAKASKIAPRNKTRA